MWDVTKYILIHKGYLILLIKLGKSTGPNWKKFDGKYYAKKMFNGADNGFGQVSKTEKSNRVRVISLITGNGIIKERL